MPKDSRTNSCSNRRETSLLFSRNWVMSFSRPQRITTGAPSGPRMRLKSLSSWVTPEARSRGRSFCALVISRIPSSPVGLSSISSSPASRRLLLASLSSRSFFLQSTVVRWNFHALMVSGSFKYSSPGMNSAGCLSPAAQIQPKRLNMSKYASVAFAALNLPPLFTPLASKVPPS